MAEPSSATDNPILGPLEEVIEQHRQLIRYAARRYGWAVGRQGIARDDLESEATLGLIKAYRRFDGRSGRNGKPAPFGAYAIRFMLGEISRFLRQYGQPVKVARPIYALAGKIIKHELIECSAAEIAGRLGCNEVAAQGALKYLRDARSVSLDEPLGEDAGTLADMFASPADDTEADVALFISELAPAERSCLRLVMRGDGAKQDGQILHELQRKARHYFDFRGGESVKQLTKEAYIEAKERGLSDGKIAAEYGMKEKNIYHLKKKWGLVGTRVKPANEAGLTIPAPADPETPLTVAGKWQERYELLLAELGTAQETIKALEDEKGLLKALLKKYL